MILLSRNRARGRPRTSPATSPTQYSRSTPSLPMASAELSRRVGNVVLDPPPRGQVVEAGPGFLRYGWPRVSQTSEPAARVDVSGRRAKWAHALAWEPSPNSYARHAGRLATARCRGFGRTRCHHARAAAGARSFESGTMGNPDSPPRRKSPVHLSRAPSRRARSSAAKSPRREGVGFPIGFVAVLTGAIAERFLARELERETREVEGDMEAATGEVTRRLDAVRAQLDELEALSPGAARCGSGPNPDCRADCRAPRFKREKPVDLQGFSEYRHGDSNPGTGPARHEGRADAQGAPQRRPSGPR
jgi:hypothetical protein